LLRIVIDSLKNYPQSQPQLIQYSLILVGIAAVEGIFRFYMRRLLIGVSRKIEYSLRSDFFAHLQRLDSTFFENNKTGSIMALMTNDLDAVRNFLGPGLLNFFNTIFVFISTLAIMFFINVRLTLFTLIAIPVLPFLVSRLSAMLYKRFKASQEHYAVLSARTQESIAGIKVVKSFTQEDRETETFEELNQQYVNKNMALARVRSAFWPLMILVGGIGALLVLLVGGRQVIFQQLTLGQFVQFSAYITALTWPLISLGWVINLIQRGEVSMGRLNKVLNISPSIKEQKKPAPLKDIKGDITFKNISFKYPVIPGFESYNEKRGGKSNKRNNWIVEDININISAGMQVGIVGFTGSGKSTLVNLIPRLYDPQKGEILIDGHNIKEISLQLLRKKSCYVTQDPFIFSKTIRENILFGREDSLASLSEEEIEKRILEASFLAHLHEDIKEFPEGYETMVGERGITLSGGQKQRLAIARALITEPAILILDDSFSNVDTNTEELILKDLRKKTEKITTIIISHRISTIRDSDQIIVIDGGRIIETGTHRKLIKKCGIYQRLHQKQKLSEELEEEL
jgi:ATP-binding cassette subfamily B protein